MDANDQLADRWAEVDDARERAEAKLSRLLAAAMAALKRWPKPMTDEEWEELDLAVEAAEGGE
jgi:hypothetical protein